MSIEVRAEGYTASCDSCGRPWRAYECVPTEPALRVALASVDDWDLEGSEAYCPRCCGERLLDKRLTDLRSLAVRLAEAARSIGHDPECDRVRSMNAGCDCIFGPLVEAVSAAREAGLLGAEDEGGRDTACPTEAIPAMQAGCTQGPDTPEPAGPPSSPPAAPVFAPRQYNATCRHALWMEGSCPECHQGPRDDGLRTVLVFLRPGERVDVKEDAGGRDTACLTEAIPAMQAGCTQGPDTPEPAGPPASPPLCFCGHQRDAHRSDGCIGSVGIGDAIGPRCSCTQFQPYTPAAPRPAFVPCDWWSQSKERQCSRRGDNMVGSRALCAEHAAKVAENMAVIEMHPPAVPIPIASPEWSELAYACLQAQRLNRQAWASVPGAQRIDAALHAILRVCALGTEEHHDAGVDLPSTAIGSLPAAPVFAPRQYNATCRHALWMEGSCPECHQSPCDDGLRTVLVFLRPRQHVEVKAADADIGEPASPPVAPQPRPIDPVRDVIGDYRCGVNGCSASVRMPGGRCFLHGEPIMLAKLYTREEVGKLLEALRSRMYLNASRFCPLWPDDAARKGKPHA